MCFSASANGAYTKKTVNEVCYSPDKSQKSAVAVADMVTVKLFRANVTYIVAVIIDMPIFIKRQFFVAINVLFTIVTVKTCRVTVVGAIGISNIRQFKVGMIVAVIYAVKFISLIRST